MVEPTEEEVAAFRSVADVAHWAGLAGESRAGALASLLEVFGLERDDHYRILAAMSSMADSKSRVEWIWPTSTSASASNAPQESLVLRSRVAAPVAGSGSHQAEASSSDRNQVLS